MAKAKTGKKISYPKKPKSTASVATLENYIAKCKEVDKKNAEREKQAKKRKDLLKKVDSIRAK